MSMSIRKNISSPSSLLMPSCRQIFLQSLVSMIVILFCRFSTNMRFRISVSLNCIYLYMQNFMARRKGFMFLYMRKLRLIRAVSSMVVEIRGHYFWNTMCVKIGGISVISLLNNFNKRSFSSKRKFIKTLSDRSIVLFLEGWFNLQSLAYKLISLTVNFLEFLLLNFSWLTFIPLIKWYYICFKEFICNSSRSSFLSKSPFLSLE